MFSFVVTVNDDGTVIASGLTLEGTHQEQQQHAQAVQTVQQVVPGAQVVEDPWGATLPPAATVAQSAPSDPWATPADPAPEPTLEGLIREAASANDLTELWKQFKSQWTEEHSKLASARKEQLAQ